ncbi:hypothetical protein [Actinomadura sp. KC216]|uniref:hypothetical protein n=1 Tax=Actinomadura sp. KC216 TaxID=2530370 RepID=UPI0014047123|nr:hypothetical protein [Actinomadura sp. KC216]
MIVKAETACRGRAGRYRLGRATRLPPVVLDEGQAVAAAIALQTVPRGDRSHS